MTLPRLRLGVFGVGRMGKVHVETLIELHRRDIAVLTALGDRHQPTLDSALAGAHLDANRLSTFDDAAEMAASGILDAVVIASRTEHHTDDALAFAARGIPVMLEKPMAASIAEAARFSAALGPDGDRLVQIGFQRRYDDAGRMAAAWVEEGRIGALQETRHVLQDKNPPPAGYQSSGITADMAIHLVFEAMHLRGGALPRTVQAMRFLAPHYDDHAQEGANIVHAFLTWPDGSVADLAGSRINATGYDNRFSLVGSEGRIDVGDFVGDFGRISCKLWRGVADGPRGELVESLDFPMRRPAPGHPDFYPRFAEAYTNEVCEFTDRVERHRRLDPGPDIGWKTLLVANLAEASSRQDGRRFELVGPNGGPITTPDAAAAFAASVGAE